VRPPGGFAPGACCRDGPVPPRDPRRRTRRAGALPSRRLPAPPRWGCRPVAGL